MAHKRESKHYSVTVLFLSVYVLNFGVKAQIVHDDEGCLTPDGGTGDCIPIKQCKTIIDFLSNSPKPISEAVKKKLNSYACSYKGNTVKVCCPYSPIEMNDKSPQGNQLFNSDPQPPDVSNHRNFNLLPTECGYLPPDQKIINGQNASLNEFPWMALLSYSTSSGPQFKCGATIINEKWILTAAHCVSNLKQPLLGVRVGEHNILTKIDCEVLEDGSTKCADPVQDLAIEKIVPHQKFNISIISNDIALLKVSRINLDVENARPVCLPIDVARDVKLSKVTVTGWGITETGRSSSILQKVNIDIINRTECQSVYKDKTNVKITHEQICAGGKKRQDSCSGDSGGPMHGAIFLNGESRYVQQGIVSFGPRACGLENFPGVYTRVAYYMDWILDNITP